MSRVLLPSLLLALVAAAPAAAQGGSCNTVDLPDVTEQYDRRLEAGVPMIYIEGPFLVRCTGGAELRARRGVINQLTRELSLFGEVDFRDPTRTLNSERAVYTSTTGRLFATGNVVFVDREEGITLTGPELEYFREIPGRPQTQVNVNQRSHLVITPDQPGDTAGAAPAREPEPLAVDADRMVIIGKNDLTAYGNVVIQRTNLDATADEARYDGEGEGLELRGNAVVENDQTVLRGEVIQAVLENNLLRQVTARTRAALESEDLDVTAPELQLFFEDDLLQRTVARIMGDTAASRPLALSPTFRLEADSIDALAPGQRLQQVVAIGRARGIAIDTTYTGVDSLVTEDVEVPDSLRATGIATADLLRNDWITGDTIIGYFATVDTAVVASAEPAEEPAGAPARDTTLVLERIVSRGEARSLYRVPPEESDTTTVAAERGINFVSGAVITLVMEEGQVQTARVEGLRQGVYLEPTPPAAEESEGDPSEQPEEETGEPAPAAPLPTEREEGERV